MQPFLGIASAARSLGAQPSSDAPASDARSAADPTNGKAFQSALNAAHQRPGGSEGAERRAGRHAQRASVEDGATAPDGDAQASEDESATDPAASADALAMLLNWLVPVTPTTPETAPAGIALTGNGDGLTSTAPIGAATDGALAAGLGLLTALPNGPVTPPIAQDSLPAATTTDGTTGAADDATAAAASAAQAAMLAASQADPSLADTSSATAGIPLTGMTATPDGDVASVTTPRTASTTTTAATPDLQAAIQATAEARSAASAADGALATGSAAAPTTGTTPADMATLAADFGAQIVAATGPTPTRPAGPGASPTGPAALADDAQVPAAGSTAQAAGASATTGVQLPGQAVAAAGASSQGTGSSLGEALEAGPDAISATQSGPNGTDVPTEFHAALGAAGAHGLTQAQDVDTVQAAPTTAPPIANQIADGAMMAARRIGQSVEMILQPEGLGSVSLRVSVERGGLAVHMAIENPQAREMVQASWPQLQQALEQRGLTVQSMMLDLSNGRGGGQGFQAFQQFSGQQFSGQQFSGQQSRGGSSQPDRRGSQAVGAVDDGTRVQSSAGAAASRVDYRL